MAEISRAAQRLRRVCCALLTAVAMTAGLAGAMPAAPLSDSVQLLDRGQVWVAVEGEPARAATDVVLPYHWDRLHGGRAGWAEFTLPFAVVAPTDEPYGLYLPRIGSTAELYLNGALLARLGRPSAPDGDDFAKSPQYLAVPARLLGERNVLQVSLRADAGRHGGLAAPRFGPAAAVYPRYLTAYRQRVLVANGVTVFSALVGLVALLMWLSQPVVAGDGGGRRRDPVYLYAALAQGCWALRMADVSWPGPPLGWPGWGIAMTAASAGWVCAVALFCQRVAGWHLRRWNGAFQAWLALLLAGGLAATTASLLGGMAWPMTAWQAMANGFFAVYTAFYFIDALRRRRGPQFAVALAGAINVAVGVRDVLAMRVSGDLAQASWLRYASLLFALVLLAFVVLRFRRAQAEAAQLVNRLTARVAETDDALRHSHAEARQLAEAEARSSERVRILRDMHDGVGAHLSAAIRQVQSGRAGAGEVLATLRGSLDQLKLSMDALHLPDGDVAALLAALRWRLEPRFAACDVALHWAVEVLPTVVRLDAAAMRQLQFMVFEALSNVLQHAHARSVRIEARPTPRGGVRLAVLDDGRGFDAGAASVSLRGLASMRARATAIGAVLAVHSRPGQTIVAIGLPLERPQAPAA